MRLKAQNRATPENLSQLAEKYLSNLPDDAAVASMAELTVTPDTNDSLINYNKRISQLHAKYEALTSSASGQNEFSDIFDPKFQEFMMVVAVNYKQAAEELKKIVVPTSLSDNHLKLINNYLSSSQAALSIGKIQDDPLRAYRGLSTQAQNSQEEASLLANIRVLLISKGLYSSEL